jgi:hypothetical protein
LDAAEVSGANQYTVKPAALVSTAVPFIVALFSVVADEPAAGLDAPAAGGALLELAELPQAAIASTAAASPAAPQIFRILHASPHRAHELSH